MIEAHSRRMATVTTMRNLLNWITREPEILAEAPVMPSMQSARERAAENHLCLACGAAADGFFWIRPQEWSGGVARWMDLCGPCCSLVYAVAEMDETG